MRHDPIDPGQFSGLERSVFSDPALRVADRMTRPAVTVRWDEPIVRACALMAAREIRHLPVLDARRRLIGLVTDADLREALVALGVHDPALAPRTAVVGFAMTADPPVVSSDRPLLEALGVMRARKVTALPVVDGEQVVGILTHDDLLRELANALRSEQRRAS
jgi:CBS domain-containing protein